MICYRCGKDGECFDTDYGPLCYEHLIPYEGDTLTQAAGVWFPRELTEIEVE